MTLFFKKTSGSQHQKTISQQNVQSLIKKTVDGMSSKFNQNIIDQIILSLQTKEGCEFVIKSLIDIIDQCADNDSSIFKALKVLYLCLITNSTHFRSYAQSCLPEIETISLLGFKKSTNDKSKNELHLIKLSQQIYLNLTLNKPLPSPKQLNLEEYVKSAAFLQVSNVKNQNILKSENNTHKSSVENIQEQSNPETPIPLSNSQYVENLIELDIPEERPSKTNNNDSIINLDDDIFQVSSSSPKKDNNYGVIQRAKSDTVTRNSTLNADIFQNIPESKDYFQPLINQENNPNPSITQSTPKLLDFIQQSPNQEFIPHKRSRELSYDAPKNDFDLFKIINNNFNDANNNFNATNSNNTKNSENNINNEYVQIGQDVNSYEIINDNADLNSYIQPSMRSKSFQIFNNVKNTNSNTTTNNIVDYGNKHPFSKEISSDSPSDIVSTPTNSQEDIKNSNNSPKKQLSYENAQYSSILENKSRSLSLDLFPSSSSLPTKTPASPANQVSVKAVRFPTSPNLKDIQNKEPKSVSPQQSVGFTNKENENDLDFLGLSKTSNEISKSNTANDIFDLSSTSNPNTNSASNNNAQNNVEIYDLSNSTNDLNSSSKEEIIDLSNTSSTIQNIPNKNSNEEIFDLSPKKSSKDDDIFDLSSSSCSLNKSNTDNLNNGNDILDLSSPISSPKPPKNNDIDILDLANSTNQNSTNKSTQSDDIDILDLSTASNNSSISKSNNNSNSNDNDEIDIIDLANSASPVDLIPFSNLSNSMNSSHVQSQSSTDELISLTADDVHSKTADTLLQRNNSNFNQISTPQFIPQSPSANIPITIRKTRNTSNADINGGTNVMEMILPSVGHQRSYSNTTPVTSPIILDSRSNVASPTAYQQYQNQLINSNDNESTSISIIDSSQEEDIIPLIETKSKTPTISASAPYMLQNQPTDVDVGNSALIPTSDSPLYSQSKRKKGSKKKSINMDINLSSSSFNHSYFSNSESSYNSFSSSDTKQQNGYGLQNTMLETIIEEDETMGRFEPIIDHTNDNGFDDNFEPIPTQEEEEESNENKTENSKFDENFEPILIEEEEGNDSGNLAPAVEFEPISPREGEIDDGFEPIDNNRENEIDDQNLFESIENEPDTSDQFESIGNVTSSNNNIYDQFEPISTDNINSIDSTKFEPIDTQNIDDENQQIGIDIDGFEPINGNDIIKQTDIENDNFEPINNNNNNKEDIENDIFEPIENNKDDNFEPITNSNRLSNIKINDLDYFEPIENHRRATHKHNHSLNSNAEFCSISSDGVIHTPISSPLAVQPRNKKFNIQKIHSLSSMPTVSLEDFDSPKNNPRPSIISGTNS